MREFSMFWYFLFYKIVHGVLVFFILQNCSWILFGLLCSHDLPEIICDQVVSHLNTNDSFLLKIPTFDFKSKNRMLLGGLND